MAAAVHPFCCLSCLMDNYKFQHEFIEFVVNTGTSVAVAATDHRVASCLFRKNYRRRRMGFLKAIIESLVEKFAPLDPPFAHQRYYQPDVLTIGSEELDIKLGGGLQKGSIYCFVEPLRQEFGGLTLLRAVINYSQTAVFKNHQVANLEIAYERAAVIITHNGPVPQLNSSCRAIDQHSFPVQANLADPRLRKTLKYDHIKALKKTFDCPNDYGLIVVDSVKAFRNWPGREDNFNPSLQDWVSVLTKCFRTLENKITVLLLDENMFPEMYPEPDLKQLALEGLAPMENLFLIEMLSREKKEWEVRQHWTPPKVMDNLEQPEDNDEQQEEGEGNQVNEQFNGQVYGAVEAAGELAGDVHNEVDGDEEPELNYYELSLYFN